MSVSMEQALLEINQAEWNDFTSITVEDLLEEYGLDYGGLKPNDLEGLAVWSSEKGVVVRYTQRPQGATLHFVDVWNRVNETGWILREYMIRCREEVHLDDEIS